MTHKFMDGIILIGMIIGLIGCIWGILFFVARGEKYPCKDCEYSTRDLDKYYQHLIKKH